jgi:hypothetical protein
MTLLTIAELLAGEALVTPGGAVDRVTAAADDYDLWAGPEADGVEAASGDARVEELVSV